MRNNKMFMVLILTLLLVPSSILYSQEDEAQQVFDQTLPGVIAFTAFDGDKEEVGHGTGFVIAEKIIATSYELVSQAQSVEGIDFKGRKVKLDGILAVDKNFGIALVSINRKNPSLPLGNADEIDSNTKIYAIGVNQLDEFSLTEGEPFNFHEYKSQRMIETSFYLPDDYNGGPVLNAAGQVIGMVVFLDAGKYTVIPSKILELLPKTGAGTKFKAWEPEEYFATIEGATLAARIFYSMGSSINATKFLTKILEFTPDDLEIHTMLADVYTKQRDYSSAISTYQNMIAIDAKNDAAYLGMGNVYIRMMNWKEAIPALEKAFQFNPEHKDALFQVGTAYQELREFDSAAEAYKKYIAAGPRQPYDAYNYLGQCQMELEQYTDAVFSFQEALKGMPDHVTIMYKMAQSQEKAGQAEQAAETYYKLAELRPEDARVYYNTVINMYNAAKMPDKAAEAANKMVALNPDDTDALFNLGFMLVQMQKYEEAIEALDRVIELNPGMEYAHLNKGYSYYSLKQYKNAIQAYSNTVELFPENSDAWMFLGMSYMQLKNWSKAVEPLRKSIELRPESGNAYYNLAICYLNLKDNYSARDVYNQLQSVDPGLAQKLKKYIK